MVTPQTSAEQRLKELGIDKAGENCDQADQCVNDGVDLQYHVIAPSVSY
jgi:hypothetical protein